MAKGKGKTSEVTALAAVIDALKGLEDPKQQSWVIASAVSNLGLSGIGMVAPVAPMAAGIGSPAALAALPGQAGTSAHARGFLRSKNPQSTVQQVACLAFYLTHHRNTPEFKTRDITKMNTDAGGLRIGNPADAVKNAYFQSGYLGRASGGRKQITALGEDVVNALPDQDAVKGVENAKPKRKKGRSKAKARTK